jgi:outer membrane protein assembly factor BamB
VFLLHVRARIVKIFLLLLTLINLFGNVAAQQTQPTQGPSARIAWSKQAGVSHYRLQIATDPQFNDVVFDRRINGYEYVVRELPAGRYYWRVAQAETQTGEFLRAIPFEVKLESAVVPKPTPAPTSTLPATTDTTVRTRRTVPGWSVATGEVAKLLSARLRPGATPDFIGVNTDGTVFALQGRQGIALWTAHFDPNSSGAKRVRSLSQQFTPLIVNIGGTAPAVVVAFDQGMRALDGASGREIWSTRIAGRPFLASLLERSGTTPRILIVGEKTSKLLIIDAATGQFINQMTMRDEIVQAPIIIRTGGEAQVLVPLKGGLLALHELDGKYLRSTKVATEITTELQVVSTARGQIVLVGLKNGLVAFDASLQGIGRIAIAGDDYPIGVLSLVDLNGDRISEVVVSTNAGRVIAVDVSDGKIKWSSEPGYPPVSPSFADLDGDANLDVILPGLKSFAVALSGANGRMIWQSGDDVAAQAAVQALAVAQMADGRLVIAGGDRSASGLRALEVNKASAKVNQ